ncbi:MAG: FAD-dependent oxidoreductase, partial [Dehalococcoidia bacterium]
EVRSRASGAGCADMENVLSGRLGYVSFWQAYRRNYPPEDIQAAFGDRVKVLLLPHSDLIFGTLVPKGSFINVSLLSRTGSPSLNEFLSHPLVKRALPFPYERACGCRPLISVGKAQNPIGDGFVAVGDAVVTRLYKDGIGAALLTAQKAAHTAVHFGTTAQAFRRHYLPLLRDLDQDNTYGRLLFSLHRRLRDSPAFSRAQARLLAQERGHPGLRPYHKALWGMFTGSYSYGEILRTALRPAFLTRLVLEAARQRLKGVALPPCRILVLGGGFGGVYTTLHLEKALRKQKAVEITLVSRENFFLFTPLLHEVATGGVETRHIAYPIRTLRGRRRFSFVQGEVKAIDLEKKVVNTDRGSLPYDFLVLALGSTTDTSQLPALAPPCLHPEGSPRWYGAAQPHHLPVRGSRRPPGGAGKAADLRGGGGWGHGRPAYR